MFLGGSAILSQKKQPSEYDVPSPNKHSLDDSDEIKMSAAKRNSNTTSNSTCSHLIERLIIDNETAPLIDKEKNECNAKDSEFLSEPIGEKENGMTEPSTLSNNQDTVAQNTQVDTEKSKLHSSDQPYRSNECQIYTTSDSSTDDFYSKFKRSSSIVSPSWSPEEEPSIEEVLDRGWSSDAAEANTRKNLQDRLADTWTEFLSPGRLLSISENRCSWDSAI